LTEQQLQCRYFSFARKVRFAAIKTKALIQGTAGMQPIPDLQLIKT
jgi:hypothetical protein